MELDAKTNAGLSQKKGNYTIYTCILWIILLRRMKKINQLVLPRLHFIKLLSKSQQRKTVTSYFNYINLLMRKGCYSHCMMACGLRGGIFLTRMA